MAIPPASLTAKTAAARGLGMFGWVGPIGCRRVGMALLLGLALVSCRTAPSPAPSTAPSPEAPLDVSTAPPSESPTEPAPTVEPPPEATPAPVPEAPNTTAPVQSEPLPDALVQQWEPMSNVLLAFGPMTVTAGEIAWGSGQTSPYTLVSTEGGFLLKLAANPSFYDIANPYVKLIPKTDASGAVTSVEVAFYEGEAQAQRDEYIMYGSYFVN